MAQPVQAQPVQAQPVQAPRSRRLQAPPFRVRRGLLDFKQKSALNRSDCLSFPPRFPPHTSLRKQLQEHLQQPQDLQVISPEPLTSPDPSALQVFELRDMEFRIFGVWDVGCWDLRPKPFEWPKSHRVPKQNIPHPEAPAPTTAPRGAADPACLEDQPLAPRPAPQESLSLSLSKALELAAPSSRWTLFPLAPISSNAAQCHPTQSLGLCSRLPTRPRPEPRASGVPHVGLSF